ncbi:MAG: hypothetical protein CMH32_06450 [Micavibrio sp.]|nr:hypothetical protein [Micavibrio sp.]HCK32208.1 hypothetical protein [Rhodospirillaceae bacterium]
MAIFKDKKEVVGILICLISAVIFGLYPSAARGAYIDGANITFVVILTTFCRLLGLYSVSLMRGLKPFEKFSDYKVSAVAGVFQAISIIGILGGAFFLPGAVVIIIMFTYSLMLLFFSAYRGDLKLNIANILSTLTALAGLALVLRIGTHDDSYPLIGILLAFMAAIATFSRSYIYGQQSKNRSPLVIGAESFSVAFVLLLFLILWQWPVMPNNFSGLTMAMLSALSLTIGSFGMFYGIAYIGAYKFSMIMKLEPVFTTIFGIILVGDVLNSSQYTGIALVLISLISLQLFDKQNDAKKTG